VLNSINDRAEVITRDSVASINAGNIARRLRERRMNAKI
jgi:hypothetical protein